MDFRAMRYPSASLRKKRGAIQVGTIRMHGPNRKQDAGTDKL